MNAPAPYPGLEKGGCWPDATQRLLLQAALLEPSSALRAWEKWKSQVDIENLDGGSYRLIPLLYQNLRRAGVQPPDLFKGNYRYHWTQGSLILRKAQEMAALFHQNEIPCMALKGLPLALVFYKDLGARPMGDMDFLVPSEKALQAIRVLREAGWQPERKDIENHVHMSHACGFRKEGSYEMDLHWHIFHEACAPGEDDDFWKDAVDFPQIGFQCKRLNAADQLLHVCVHGMKWNRMPPLRWLADAWVLLQASGNELDHDRLQDQALRCHMALPVQKTLLYLTQHLETRLPEEIVRAWRGMPISTLERVEYPMRTSPYFEWLQPLFAYSRWRFATGKTRGLRSACLYFIFLAWKKCKPKMPGVIKYLVRRTTEALGFQAPWMGRRPEGSPAPG